MRRRARPRRTSKRLGTCSVDLSGPHEATPRPGKHYMKDPCYYYLALTVRPDLTADTREMAIQATPDVQTAEFVESSFVELDDALTYAALLGTNSEAALAIKHSLAQINNDHANFLMRSFLDYIVRRAVSLSMKI